MPRRPRQEEAGAIHHVYARGNDKRDIYLGDADRRLYLSLLEATVWRAGWHCLAYCLMENHVHLVIETSRPNLGVGMQRVHGEYALLFNRRHRRSGHLFQGRYGAKRVTTDEYFWTVLRYIAENPVEAGLAPTPGTWAWDSVAATMAGRAPGWLAAERLLGYVEGIGGGRGLERYRDLVAGRG